MLVWTRGSTNVNQHSVILKIRELPIHTIRTPGPDWIRGSNNVNQHCVILEICVLSIHTIRTPGLDIRMAYRVRPWGVTPWQR